MGYDLHITRAEDWTDADDAPILRDEWRTLALDDSELFAMPENGDVFFAFGDRDNPTGWFDWSDGTVFTTGPDRATLEKMLGLAEQLGARVQGDEGEEYTSADDLSA
jgi:hypothetical protein